MFIFLIHMIETPFVLNKTITLKNRIVMAPMCMYQSDITGEVKPFHETHYHMHAMGGVSLVIVEATSVLPNGVISHQDLGIWSDSHVEGLKKIVDRIQKEGAMSGIHLNHAGRKARVENPVGPSRLGYDETSILPEAITDVDSYIKAFQEGARRANEAGFDVLEIHAAHGYLICQFMSPISNQRNDRYKDYGLFLNDVLESVYEVWPIHKALTIRVSATEYHPQGYDTKGLIKLLKGVNLSRVDAIHVSSGGNIKPLNVEAKTGYQLSYAKEIKEALKIPTIGGGMLLSKDDGEEALQNSQCDLVFYGRLLLRDPFIFLRTVDGIHWPKAYVRGK